MTITPISYEERVDRVTKGFASDPRYAVSVLKELSNVSLFDIANGDQGVIESIAMPLVCRGIRSNSSLGAIAWALDKVWDRGKEGQQEIIKPGLAVARLLAARYMPDAKGHTTSSKQASNTEGDKLQVIPETPIPFAERVARLSNSSQQAIRRGCMMKYAAYLYAVEAEVGLDACNCISELESCWNVETGVRLADIMIYIEEHPDYGRMPWLLDHFLVKPMAALHEHYVYEEVGEVDEVDLDDAIDACEAQHFQLDVLNLKPRTYNALGRARISTVADLIERSPVELLEIRNFNLWCLEDVERQLRARGLSLTSCDSHDDFDLSEFEAFFECLDNSPDEPEWSYTDEEEALLENSGEFTAHIHEQARKAARSFSDLPMSFLMQGDPESLAKLEECAANRMEDFSVLGAFACAIDKMWDSPSEIDRGKAREMLSWYFPSLKEYARLDPSDAHYTNATEWLEWAKSDAVSEQGCGSPCMGGSDEQLHNFFLFMRLSRGAFLGACRESPEWATSRAGLLRGRRKHGAYFSMFHLCVILSEFKDASFAYDFIYRELIAPIAFLATG